MENENGRCYIEIIFLTPFTVISYKAGFSLGTECTGTERARQSQSVMAVIPALVVCVSAIVQCSRL